MSFSEYIKPHSNIETSEPHQSSSSSSIMPKKLQKSLQDCLSKLKNPNSQIKFSSSKNWILSGCKHPKTPSLDIDNYNNRRNTAESQDEHITDSDNHDAATLSDIDRFLFENFKSLYVKENDDDEEEEIEKITKSEERVDDGAPMKLGPILFDSPRFDVASLPPDLRGSNRFFVTPGRSGSLVDDAATSSSSVTTTGDEAGSSSTTSTTSPNDSLNSSNYYQNRHSNRAAEALPRDFIAVLTYSPSPYEDFRRSMRDMVEAKFKNNEKVDWDFMEELLFCYLNLNDKKSHKFILSAFVDLIAGLRRPSERSPAPAKARSVRTVKIGREGRRKKMKDVTLEFGSS